MFIFQAVRQAEKAKTVEQLVKMSEAPLQKRLDSHPDEKNSYFDRMISLQNSNENRSLSFSKYMDMRSKLNSGQKDDYDQYSTKKSSEAREKGLLRSGRLDQSTSAPRPIVSPKDLSAISVRPKDKAALGTAFNYIKAYDAGVDINMSDLRIRNPGAKDEDIVNSYMKEKYNAMKDKNPVEANKFYQNYLDLMSGKKKSA